MELVDPLNCMSELGNFQFRANKQGKSFKENLEWEIGAGSKNTREVYEFSMAAVTKLMASNNTNALS